MTDQPQQQMVTIAALRALCGAGAGEIEALIRARAVSVRDGKVPLIAGVRAYLDAVRAKARAASLTTAAEASRLARAEADEVMVATASRDLIPRDDAEDALGTLAGVVNTIFATVPVQATRIITERRQIEAALRAAQTAWAASLRNLDATPAKPARKSRPKKDKTYD